MEYVWVCHGDEYAELCNQSQATVKAKEKDAQLTVFTDKKYGLMGERVIPYYHDHPFMLMNLMCQSAYLAELGVRDGTVVFLDVDAYMAKPLPDLGEGWDIAVTWRDNMGDLSMLMPYNYGVVLAKHTIQSISSWFWMTHRITLMSSKNQKWYGNQIALRELCGPINYEDSIITRDLGFFDVRVKHLPCEEYNWTPQLSGLPVGDKHFVHCKGDRKDLLNEYFQECLKVAA